MSHLSPSTWRRVLILRTNQRSLKEIKKHQSEEIGEKLNGTRMNRKCPSTFVKIFHLLIKFEVDVNKTS